MAAVSEATELGVETVVLSPRALQIIGGIADPQLRERVEGVLRRCLVALGTMQRIHLPQDHFEAQDEEATDHQHPTLAPFVLRALDAIHGLLAYLVEEFPAPAGSGEDPDGRDDLDLDDFDLEFDLVDGPGGEGGLSSARAAPERSMTPAEAAADAAHAFGGMLRSRVVEFGQRLDAAIQSGDGWKLLGELDDFKHRVAKSVMGLLFGVLSVFSNVASREEILPEYRSAVSESVALRGAVTELAYQIGRFNESLADPEIAVPLMVGVADHLARFSARPVYRTLRAEDKRAVIDFRRELYQLRFNREPDGGFPMTRLRRAVEGFSKFLESLQAINHREVLVLHDRQVLSEALEELGRVQTTGAGDLAAAKQTLEGVIHRLGAVLGRNPDLDAELRRHRAGVVPQQPPDAAAARWLALVQGALAGC